MKHFLPQNILEQIYLTLLYPHLTYCILAWGKTNQSTLQPITLIQKKAVRILADKDYQAHTNPIFKSLKILKLNDIYTFYCLIHMYKTLEMNIYPSYKEELVSCQPNHRHNLRHPRYTPPLSRIMKCDQKVLYQGTKSWNNLSPSVKDSHSLASFKKNCKGHLLSLY